jgi:hypothetical protein
MIGYSYSLARDGNHLGFEWKVRPSYKGYLIGYVCVPKGHPWYGKEDWEIELSTNGSFSEVDIRPKNVTDYQGSWFKFSCVPEYQTINSWGSWGC